MESETYWVSVGDGFGKYVSPTSAIDIARKAWESGKYTLVYVSDDTYTPEKVIWENGMYIYHKEEQQ